MNADGGSNHEEASGHEGDRVFSSLALRILVMVIGVGGGGILMKGGNENGAVHGDRSGGFVAKRPARPRRVAGVRRVFGEFA